MKPTQILSTLALLCAAPFAAAQTYNLSTSLDDTLITGTVGTLSFTQVGNDTRLDLHADWDSALLGSSVFLSRLFLTYGGSPDLTLPSGTGGTVVAGGGELPGAGINAGYHFDYAVHFPVSNKGNRLNDGENVSLLFANADAADFGALAMVHLQGLNGGGSVKVITTPVPEPETWALLGLGLGSIVALRRRRKA